VATVASVLCVAGLAEALDGSCVAETEETDETEDGGGSGTRAVRPYNGVHEVLNAEIAAP